MAVITVDFRGTQKAEVPAVRQAGWLGRVWRRAGHRARARRAALALARLDDRMLADIGAQHLRMGREASPLWPAGLLR